MSTILNEIRLAVQDYVRQNVSTDSRLIQSGGTINPGETFSVQMSATNADAANNGIPLKNLRWFVQSTNEDVVTLTVPNGSLIARSDLSKSSPELTPGTQVQQMYLFPEPGARTYLGVGDTDSISVPCRAGSAPSGGSSIVAYSIYADIDEDWLFPKDQDIDGARGIEVVG